MPDSHLSERALNGVRVLVTRPSGQAENLAQHIEQAGGEAILFPSLEITELENPQTLHAIIDRLKDFALAIFISPNAVDRGMKIIFARLGHLPENLTIACVGHGSARALAKHGVTNAILPSGRFDSEALLELPALQHVAGKEIVIFRGQGGRELLGDTLKKRGARIVYAECYRRIRPNTDITPLLQQWEQGGIDIVIVTSAEGLQNLFDMLGPVGQKRLIRTPLVTVSERLSDLCRELGFKTPPRIAEPASDEAMLEAIKAWRATQKTL